MVVSDPFKDAREVLVVNITTVRDLAYEDLSCVFESGEHEWIDRKSYVAFDMARTYPDALLDRLRDAILRAARSETFAVCRIV